MPTKKTTDRKHVVHVVQHLSPGGIECLALELQRIMSPGLRVSIISLEGEADTSLQAWPKLKNTCGDLVFMNKSDGLSPGLIAKLYRWMRKENVDLVHTHHIGPLIYGGCAARLAGAKVVHTEHDAWHLSCPKRARVQRTILRLIRPHVIADAHLVADAFEAAVQRAPDSVIHNGVDCDRFKPGDKHVARRALGLSHTGPLIGCAARLEPVKGVDRLIKAMGLLNTNIHLAIAGDGSEAETLRTLAETEEVADRVHFLGSLDSMTRFYQAIDVFALTSRHEGLPLSPLEAQSCGVPVVASRVGGMAEALCPTTGQLVSGDDQAELSAALLNALGRPKTVTPRQFVTERVSIANMISRYRDVYGFAS